MILKYLYLSPRRMVLHICLQMNLMSHFHSLLSYFVHSVHIFLSIGRNERWLSSFSKKSDWSKYFRVKTLLNLPFLANLYKLTGMSGPYHHYDFWQTCLFATYFFAILGNLFFCQYCKLIFSDIFWKYFFPDIFATYFLLFFATYFFANLVDLLSWYFLQIFSLANQAEFIFCQFCNLIFC